MTRWVGQIILKARWSFENYFQPSKSVLFIWLGAVGRTVSFAPVVPEKSIGFTRSVAHTSAAHAICEHHQQLAP